MSLETPQPSQALEVYDQAFVDHVHADAKEDALNQEVNQYGVSERDVAGRYIADVIKNENVLREIAVIKGESAFYRSQNEELKAQNELLEEDSRVDARTGFLTKEAFTEEVAGYFEEAKSIADEDREYERATDETKKSLAIIALDLDNLRQFNEFGHDVGDRAIEQFAINLSETLRDGDIVGRGSKESDEFVIAAKGLDEETLKNMVSRLFSSVHGTQVAGKNGEPVPIDMTMSVGAVIFTEQEFNKVADMLSLADARQIEAKKAGKDRAVFTGAGMIEE